MKSEGKKEKDEVSVTQAASFFLLFVLLFVLV